MGGLQFCGLMTLATPLWAGAAAKLAGRMLVSPLRYFRRVDRSAATFPDPLPGMAHLEVDNGGVKLHAATHGLGSGKPLLVLLHGFPETWAAWRHQIKEFAGQYEIVALDLRGFGDSGAPKDVRAYTLDKLCSDVAAVIAAAGHTTCHLVGHGWGGAVAWHFAVLHPSLVERLVVLCCPHPAAFYDPQRFDRKQIDKGAFSMLCQYSGLPEAMLRHGDFRELDRMLTKPPTGALTPGAFTEQDVARYKAALARPGRLTAALGWVRAAFRAATKWDLPALDKPLYTPVTAPTLLLYAEHDGFVLPQMYQANEKLVEKLSLVRLDGCSHWAQQDKPELVNHLIHSFLAGVDPTASHGKGKKVEAKQPKEGGKPGAIVAMVAPPSKLDLYLEGLAAFQEGAAALKAGDPLCLQQLDGGRLACATREGAAVGLVPADKRGLLSRGPWSGTVRSVKRQHVAAAADDGQAPASAPAAAHEAADGEQPPGQQPQQQQEGSTAAAAASAADDARTDAQASDEMAPPPAPAAAAEQQQQAAPPQLAVVQVLVRFTPQEQRWEQRAQEGAPVLPEEDAARLSTEQLQALADSEELRWMLRDERLQKVVAEIDGAPDRERALLRALQAPNFKEFADKVLAVVAPEPSA
ncbi:hypothetical protein ABPG75_002754 [Micractinium tetrahymenae]